jgi:hypothetical protein
MMRSPSGISQTRNLPDLTYVIADAPQVVHIPKTSAALEVYYEAPRYYDSSPYW